MNPVKAAAPSNSPDATSTGLGETFRDFSAAARVGSHPDILLRIFHFLLDDRQTTSSFMRVNSSFHDFLAPRLYRHSNLGGSRLSGLSIGCQDASPVIPLSLASGATRLCKAQHVSNIRHVTLGWHLGCHNQPALAHFTHLDTIRIVRGGLPLNSRGGKCICEWGHCNLYRALKAKRLLLCDLLSTYDWRVGVFEDKAFYGPIEILSVKCDVVALVLHIEKLRHFNFNAYEFIISWSRGPSIRLIFSSDGDGEDKPSRQPTWTCQKNIQHIILRLYAILAPDKRLTVYFMLGSLELPGHDVSGTEPKRVFLFPGSLEGDTSWDAETSGETERISVANKDAWLCNAAQYDLEGGDEL